ncbi:unnamed protein product [Lactuca saligna]|uniref:Uncharacterized protein n=1 Tax=Lactuca saligna TaxID=75948 RepID=A0AA35ZC17_LACSI|nr:unnamed protein product [Lactuca saligna]
MRNTKTTSFKSKFKNTQETIFNLDEHVDDFVAPPIEADPVPINVDTTSQTNVKRTYHTRSTPVKENISTQPTEGVRSEPNDMNIVGSSKIKKHRKTTSRSEHGKNNVYSGKSEVNKDKEDIIPIEHKCKKAKKERFC